MKFTNLSKKEFQEFTNKNFSHYTQDIKTYDFYKKNNKEVHLVGLKDENQNIKIACLLTASRSLKIFKYFYSQRGPVFATNDNQEIKFFFKSLIKYLKKNKCLYLRIDPYILENLRKPNGEIIKHHDNQEFKNIMDQLGYQHQGYTVGYSKISQIRWLSVLNLLDKSEDEILKDMNYQTRRNIKKTYEMGVQVQTLPIDETPRFFELFKMAEEKHGFSFRDEPYFEKMQKMYGDQAQLKLAYIDLNKLLASQKENEDSLKNKLKEIETKLEESPNSKKNKNKYNQTSQQLKSQQKKIKETNYNIENYGNKVDLAAALYIFNNHEVYYLSSGSNPTFNPYMGAYRLQWEMIKFAKENNIPRYNFYGITGDFSDNAEDKGVQEFKEGFNANIEEYIGDYIKPIRPILYNAYKKILGR